MLYTQKERFCWEI